ncbi:hypothetical protein [uncultured Pontibacter sp.]|uniref:hypothetical protein n=1 Tax=uncultured Pontibacter sp. TaxID=453356 RepID=UPI00261DEC32|nr:hypothetical protein [uncultured Pontibacter sp.]
MGQISIKEVATIRKPKEGEGAVGNLLHVLSLLFYPVILLGGLILMAFAACLSFFQSMSRTKEEKERLKTQLNDGAAVLQWTYWTQISDIKLSQKLIGEIHFGPAYFAVKSEPTISELDNKIFGDWFFHYENGLFIQQWNSTKSADTNLLHIDTKDLQVSLVKASIPSVNWNMLKTEENALQLECDTGKEILKFVIETKKALANIV